MKVVAIADLHGHLIENIPPCDLLLIAGDVCPAFDHSYTFQYSWLTTNFNLWLEKQPAKMIVMVPGNHDLIFDTPDRVHPYLKCKMLIDETFQYEDVVIYGHPYAPFFCDWAFMPGDHVLEIVNREIPDNIDILLTHASPKGILDTIKGVTEMLPDGTLQNEHLGCRFLRQAVERVKPKLHVFGHIHDSHGRCSLGGTEFVNASAVGEAYTVDFEPVVIELKQD